MTKINYLKPLLAGVLLLIGAVSCTVPTENMEMEVPTKVFVVEDIFEGGGNTANAIELNMKELLESNPDLTSENLYEAVLSSVTISKTDSAGLSQVKGAKLSFSCDDLDMLVVAANNEISGEDNSVALDVMEDVEIQEYLKQEVIYLTLDLDYRQDMEEAQSIEAGIKFDIKVEKTIK